MATSSKVSSKSTAKAAAKSTTTSTAKAAAKSTTKSTAKAAAKATTKSSAKSNKLVIVESPSKAKTISKFLGRKYKVIASSGHIIDLPKSRMGVDIENDFEPEYINVRGRAPIIKEIKKEASQASDVYLATDPDREGEAISWHISNMLGMDIGSPTRVVFNEITKPAITEAIENPRPIDMSLVDAQQARRVVDRIVGYKISPVLWSKVKRGLSAGRVQSAALKMICDREREILAFVPKEYWNIIAELASSEEGKKSEQTFQAKLAKFKDKKLTVGNKEEADAILEALKAGNYTVESVEMKERLRKPYAPFTTSSLQQDASAKLNFAPRRTMMVAQQLYEGCNIKGIGSVGLVSYIRTDSVRISKEADSACKAFIVENYSEKYLGKNFYSNKKKDTQDAHEAIRPSNVGLTPERVKDSLTSDQYRLYNLIWSRFVASRMKPAVFDGTSVDIKNGDYTFKAQGSVLKFDGFLKVYNVADKEEKDSRLPALREGQSLIETALSAEQNFTQPPSRYTEAGLIKDMEEKGIGRPSTYAPTVTTLSQRKYVTREKKTLIPTELGMVVNEIMEEYFKDIVDIGFTAEMENKLDDIESNGTRWQSVVRELYEGSLKEELETARKNLQRVELPVRLAGEDCELCGRPMVIKDGRFGEFMACSGYPECRNTKSILKKIGVKCPDCGSDIVERRSKKGKVFYGCSAYPDCERTFFDKPTDKKCPECGSVLLQKGKSLICSNKECGYKE